MAHTDGADGPRVKVSLCKLVPVSTSIFGGKSHPSFPGMREEETPSSSGNLCPAFRQRRRGRELFLPQVPAAGNHLYAKAAYVRGMS